jgi:hypothetical protein
MTKQTDCTTCGGSGEPPDPLEQVQCPACWGNGCHPCDRCGNEGSFDLPGYGSKPKKCACCKGEGGYPCGVCRGDQLVEVLRLKPSLGEADLEDLQKAKEALAETEKQLEALTFTGDWRDDAKAYQDTLKAASRYLPHLRKCGREAEDILKRLTKEEQLTNAKESRTRALQRFVTFNRLHLVVQIQVLDLCIARQEHNQKVMAEKEN